MYCVKKMTEDLYWVGGNDRRLALFENVYPIPRGVSYNAYVVLDEKTVLLDTVDNSVSPIFFENLAHVLETEENEIFVDGETAKKAIVCIERMLDFSAQQKAKAQNGEAKLTSGMGAA